MKKQKYADVVDPDGKKFGDEPVVLFRAKDRFMPIVVAAYIGALKDHGYVDDSLMVSEMKEILSNVNFWQKQNQGMVNYPGSV